MQTPRDQLLDDLATGFGDADFDPWDLLEFDTEGWEHRTRRVCVAHPELAHDLLSISLADVAEQWRELAHDQAERVGKTLPPREMGELREAKVRYGLEQRSVVERLDALLGDAVEREMRRVMELPPGGRDEWRGLRRNDVRRLA